jgi:hypothetical protein
MFHSAANTTTGGTPHSPSGSAEGSLFRLHDTPLYNSIYRFDDDVLVNSHVYGILAAFTPVMHLRRVDGGYFNTYLESFERVWASARPLDGVPERFTG